MKAVRELKMVLAGIYNSGNLTRQDVNFVISKVREILENKGAYKNAYPELNLFCNWCFHSKLSGSTTIYKALINISKSISNATAPEMSDEEKVNTTKDFISISANILNIPNLRIGLKTVLEDFGIDARVATEKVWWGRLLRLLLNEITEKPLQFPDNVVSGEITKGHAYDAFIKLIEMPGKDNHDKIISLELHIDSKEKAYMMHLKSLSGMTYILGIQGDEPDENFNS